MLGDLKSVLSWLPARERWRWFLLVPVAGLAALIEAAGALAVFGLLRLVVDPEQVTTAPVVSRLWSMWPTSDPREKQVGRPANAVECRLKARGAKAMLALPGGKRASAHLEDFERAAHTHEVIRIEPRGAHRIDRREPGVESGSNATLVMRAWETALGSFESAVRAGYHYGESAPFLIRVGGGPLPAAYLDTLQPFDIVVPEPGARGGRQ